MISKSNHVKFARFVLLGVSEEAKTITSIFSVQCILKQLLDSVFVIFRIGGFHVTQVSLIITQVKNKIVYHSLYIESRN